MLAPRRGPVPPQRQRQARPPERRKGGVLGALLYSLLFLLFVAGAAGGYLLLNPPSDLIRDTLARQIKAKTDRDLVIAGPTSFTIFPSLGVSMRDVTLSAPANMGGAPLVTMAELAVAVKTSALLKGEVGVKKLVLKQPVFNLRVDRSGHRSWDFAAAVMPARYAQAGAERGTLTDAPASPSAGGQIGITLPKKLTDIRKLQLNDVRIEDGTLRYTDERSGQAQEVKSVNVNLALKSWTTPVTASGDLEWKGERTAFDGKLTNARTVLEQKPAKLVFNAKNRFLDASYDGVINVLDGADLDGKVAASADSVKALAGWLGAKLPDVPGFGPFSLSGNLRTAGNQTSLMGSSFSLDGATATGDFGVTTGGARPQVEARLNVSELDLNKYMTGTAAGDAAIAPGTAPPAAKGAQVGPSESGGGADAIEQLLADPAKGPKVQGYARREGWSSEPLNFGLLAIVDTQARLQVGRLLFRDIKIGQSALSVILSNKFLKTTFDDVQLYDGHGKGFLNIDARNGKAANIGANFTLAGVSAQPLLKDAAEMDWLAGTSQLAMQLSAGGGSELQLVESLNGKANMTFQNGAIVGFNLPGAIRGISQGKLSGLKKAPSEKTDFSELTASFDIVSGIAQNQDLTLTSPLLRLTGAGSVDMPRRTLDYTVKPKLVASLEGQEGAADLSGLEIPVRISGPWSKPNYEPDIKGVDGKKVVDTVKEIAKKYKGKNAKEIVDDLFGEKSEGATGSTSKAKDLLKNLLKQQ